MAASQWRRATLHLTFLRLRLGEGVCIHMP
jgi:hypothetical protein